MIKRRKNLLKLTGVALLAALVMGIGTTGAIIQHNMQLTNEVRTPTVVVEIPEEIGEVDSNGEKQKEVAFTNTGTADVFLRIAYAEQWSYENPDTGDVIILPNTDQEGNSIAAINWSGSEAGNWQKLEDGWMYYRKVLPADGRTENIVESVTFPSSYADERYKTADYQLHFQAEVVQASDEWKVSEDAVQSVFGRKISIGTMDWVAQKYSAIIGWE